jgi:hypothetical protein
MLGEGREEKLERREVVEKRLAIPAGNFFVGHSSALSKIFGGVSQSLKMLCTKSR